MQLILGPSGFKGKSCNQLLQAPSRTDGQPKLCMKVAGEITIFEPQLHGQKLHIMAAEVQVDFEASIQAQWTGRRCLSLYAS